MKGKDMSMKQIFAGVLVGLGVILGTWALGSAANANERECNFLIPAVENVLGCEYTLGSQFRDPDASVLLGRSVELVDVVDVKSREFKKSYRGFKKAVKFAKGLKKAGYDVEVTKTGKRKFTVTGTKVTQVEIESDGNSDAGRRNTATDGNFGDGRQNGRGDTPD